MNMMNKLVIRLFNDVHMPLKHKVNVNILLKSSFSFIICTLLVHMNG